MVGKQHAESQQDGIYGPGGSDGSHHVEIFFHGDDGIPGIDTVVCGKHRFVMDVLYKLLDKPCTDAACEVVEQEAFRPPDLLEYTAEHPNGKHVEEQMGKSAVHEHISNQLCCIEIFGKEKVQSQVVV